MQRLFIQGPSLLSGTILIQKGGPVNNDGDWSGRRSRQQLQERKTPYSRESCKYGGAHPAKRRRDAVSKLRIGVPEARRAGQKIAGSERFLRAPGRKCDTKGPGRAKEKNPYRPYSFRSRYRPRHRPRFAHFMEPAPAVSALQTSLRRC